MMTTEVRRHLISLALISAVVAFLSLVTGCDVSTKPGPWWGVDAIDSACRVNSPKGRADPDCAVWTLTVGKTPIAVFWGYKDAEHNRAACYAARASEPNSECWPAVLGF